MQIFFTDHEILRHVYEHPPELEAALNHLETRYIPNEMPFFIGSAGEYMYDLNAFLLSLPTSGCPSPRSWRAYALDIQTFALFLRTERNVADVLRATHDDVQAFQHRRRNGTPPELSPGSWNRTVAALEKLFDWAYRRELIAKKPFFYTSGVGSRRRSWGSGEKNTLYVHAPAEDVVKCVSLREYRFFRDVGLLGKLPAGGHDPKVGPHNGKRNALIADLLINTGMRVTEALALTPGEFPSGWSMRDPAVAAKMTLPAAVTKWRKERDVRIPHVILKALADYDEERREHAILGARDRGIYDDHPFIRVKREGRRLRRIDGAAPALFQLDELDPVFRRKLVEVDGSGGIVRPLQRFLTYDGRPVTPDNVRVAFSRACERCARFDVHLDISPHSLRHTYAVHMLARLLEGLTKKIGRLDVAGRAIGAEALQALAFNPLLILRKMLGHSSVETTYKYLTYVAQDDAMTRLSCSEIGLELVALDELVRDFRGELA